MLAQLSLLDIDFKWHSKAQFDFINMSSNKIKIKSKTTQTIITIKVKKKDHSTPY